MLHPTINELTKDGEINRYELALATAKCARKITDEYVRQRDQAEKSLTGNKETDRPIMNMIDKDLRDEKAVKVAIDRIYDGEYTIVEHCPEEEEAPVEEKSEGLIPDISLADADTESDDAEEADAEDDETEDAEEDSAEEEAEASDDGNTDGDENKDAE